MVEAWRSCQVEWGLAENAGQRWLSKTRFSVFSYWALKCHGLYSSVRACGEGGACGAKWYPEHRTDLGSAQRDAGVEVFHARRSGNQPDPQLPGRLLGPESHPQGVTAAFLGLSLPFGAVSPVHR